MKRERVLYKIEFFMLDYQLLIHLTKSCLRVSPGDGPTERGGKIPLITLNKSSFNAQIDLALLVETESWEI